MVIIILSPGTKLLYDDLSDFRVIIVVYIYSNSFSLVLQVIIPIPPRLRMFHWRARL